MLIEPRGARVVGLVFMVGAKVLDTVASVYALSVAPQYVQETNGLAAQAYLQYGPTGMGILTAIAIGLLYIVVEYGAGYLRDHDESPHRKKNLVAVYALGYWVPAVWWLWVGLYNINVVYRLSTMPGSPITGLG